MPSPTVTAVHVNMPLTNVSIGFKNPSYVVPMVFQDVNVQKQSDIVPAYDKSHWFRSAARLRAPGTKSTRGGFKITKTDTYFSTRYSFGMEIPDELRDNADTAFNMDRDATNFVTEKLMLAKEISFATDFFAASKGWTDKTGGTDFTKWSDYSGSSPLTDVETYKDAIEALIGREGNRLLIGKQVYIQLKWHPDVLDTIKYTQRGLVTAELLASLMEVQSVLVGRAIYTSSAEGVAEASATYARIFGKNGLLLYVPPGPSLLTPAAGYNFVWNRVPNASQYIKTMRDDEKEIDIIEVNGYFDYKQTVGNAGVFLSGAVA